MAIKNPVPFGSQEMLIFLEEIKSMLEIDQYHENIVNLQGIVYGKEDVAKGLPKVYFSLFHFISEQARENFYITASCFPPKLFFSLP